MLKHFVTTTAIAVALSAITFTADDVVKVK